MADTTPETTPVESIVDDETNVRYGDAAREQGIDAVTTIADCVATTFGPYGRDKLVVDNGQNVEVTNETVSILRSLHIDDPTARLVRDATNSQIYHAGDGTTATVVLMGALLERAEELHAQGLHPTTVCRGYERAHAMAVDALGARTRRYDLSDRTLCEQVARTVFEGTSVSFDKDLLASLVYDAVSHVTTGYDVDLNSLRVLTDSGRPSTASGVVDGAVVDAVPTRETATDRRDANLLVVDGAVEPTTSRRDHTVSLDTSAAPETLRETETRLNDAVVDRLTDLDVDVLVAESVADGLEPRLGSAGITCLTAVSDTDRRFLARTLRTRQLSSVNEATPTDVATADVAVDFDAIKTTVTSESSGTVTLRLFSTVDAFGAEVESTVNDAIEVVAQVASDGRVLPGGGAVEASMAAAVRDQVASVDGREQLAVFAFAEALETLPRTLARNAGLDPLDTLVALRTAHDDGRHGVGVDARGGGVADAWELGLVDTAVVKEHVLSNALQAVRTILRIDGIVEHPEAEPRDGV